MITIYDIAQLSTLRTISETTNLKLELHGGVAFRFALQNLSNNEKPVDLFDLTPFTADVDLLHSGSDDKTKDLFDTILRIVPNADCFRWEVRSQNEHRQFREAAEYDHQIPARRISLTSDGICDSLGGMADIRTKRFRFIFRKSFNESPLFRRGRNLEIFAALLYLQTLLQADLSDHEWYDQPGLDDVQDIFRRAASESTKKALEESHYLRTRLTYLLINTLGAVPVGRYWLLKELFRFEEFLAWLASTTLPISSDIKNFLSGLMEGAPRVLSPSSQLRRGSDRYRLPFVTKPWAVLHSTHKKYSRFPVALAPGHIILMASPTMKLESGTAVCPQEFIYFALPQNEASSNISQYRDIDLSMVVVMSKWWRKWWPFSTPRMYSIPCVVQRRLTKASYGEGPLTLFVRANVMNLYNIFAQKPGAESQFFLVGLEQ